MSSLVVSEFVSVSILVEMILSSLDSKESEMFWEGMGGAAGRESVGIRNAAARIRLEKILCQ